MYIPQYKKMPKNLIYIFSIVFSCIIILSNYLVNFTISSTHITYGALSYPLSFLLMDILSEKYNRTEVVKCLRIGLIVAFVPSYFISENYLVAIASICAFFISQFLDVNIFFRLKKAYPSKWWFRNIFCAGFAQLIDTFIFFTIAFATILPYYDVAMMSLSDFSIKILVIIIDTPVFYFIAIRSYESGFISFVKSKFKGINGTI